MSTALATGRPATTPKPAVPRAARQRSTSVMGTAVLLLGAVYCLTPVAWVIIAATKSRNDLFDTLTFLPGTALFENIHELTIYRGGMFWEWTGNTALYAGVGAFLSAILSGLTGYTLAKYRFAGRDLIFNILLAGVLVPAVTLAIPQYLLMAKVGLTDSYWSVLLPSIVSPYGMYLARIYAAAAIPDSLIEAARTDGASDLRIFTMIALPIMRPGLVTVFLFQFVAIWNNFLLAFVMLSDDHKFPLTVGLYTLLKQGNTTPALYTLVITGSLLSILPLAALFLTLQRYWRIDLLSGATRG
ncbi:carbohydrate ABC transporter permease [Luedemannella helvata]|uniref:Carbohydrate ABC transporter permease n=1 Tax=Luedemannella helvata TaxID=349315 RepID=A0ABP4W4I7_9ACTN